MAYTTVLDHIPKYITIGASVSWTASFPDYIVAPDLWTLTYSIIKADRSISIVAVASGDGYLVEIPYTTTAAYESGEYAYQAYVDNGTERYLVEIGSVIISTDFAANSEGYDHRTHAKRVLDAIEAVIEDRASKTQLSQSVAGVEVQHMTLEQLISARDKYRIRYLNEQVVAGNKKARIIKPRFHS